MESPNQQRKRDPAHHSRRRRRRWPHSRIGHSFTCEFDARPDYYRCRHREPGPHPAAALGTADFDGCIHDKRGAGRFTTYDSARRHAGQRVFIHAEFTEAARDGPAPSRRGTRRSSRAGSVQGQVITSLANGGPAPRYVVRQVADQIPSRVPRKQDTNPNCTLWLMYGMLSHHAGNPSSNQYLVAMPDGVHIILRSPTGTVGHPRGLPSATVSPPMPPPGLHCRTANA